MVRLDNKKAAAAAFLFYFLSRGLFRIVGHIIYRCFHVLILKRGVSALWRHKSGLALKPFKSVFIQSRVALGNAVTPDHFVAEFRRAGNNRGMTNGTGRVVNRLAFIGAGGVRGRNQAIHYRRADSKLTNRLDTLRYRFIPLI